MEVVEKFLSNPSFIGRHQALVFHERLDGRGVIGIDGLNQREVEVGVGEVGVELRG